MENQTSFDLDGAIRRWRGELANSGSLRAEDVEELESHLRDSEESLRAHGLTAEEAFLIAVRRTGSGDVLAAEFAAINRSSVWQDRLLWMVAGSIVLPVPVGLAVALLGGNIILGVTPTLPAFAAMLWLQSNLVNKTRRVALRLTSVLFLVGFASVYLKLSLATDYWIAATIQFVVSVAMLALFSVLRLRRSHA